MRGFGDIAERLRRSTVQIFNGDTRSQGSGIVWNAGGLILTNSHVARSSQTEIELWDGRRFSARLASRDPRRDLATLRLVGVDSAALDPRLEPATPGDSTTLRPGVSGIRGMVCAGKRPVKVSRNATRSQTSAAVSSRASCVAAITRTASDSVGTEPLWK